MTSQASLRPILASLPVVEIGHFVASPYSHAVQGELLGLDRNTIDALEQERAL